MRRSNLSTGSKVKPVGSSVKAAPKKGVRKLPNPSQNGTKKSDSSRKALARYISKEMVLKLAGKDAPIEVTTVNLTLSKVDGKKIQFIENLEPFTRIQVLCLAYNQISKIEHLDRLTKIRDLDLSCNRIEKIEGLETLVNLQRLNLSDNLIEVIPAWVGKKLRALRVLHITGNMLFSLNDVFRLRHLQDLTDLAIAGNPICDLPHYRLYAIFHLRGLELLDGVVVVDKERHDAETRFAQEEIQNLGGQLEREEKKFHNLEENHNKSLVEAKKREEKMADIKKKQSDDKKRMKALEEELQAKDDLLKRKTAELTKACQKQYKLEQELAFHKIDAKFEPLGYFPDTLEIEEGGTEESAYLGRASYKRNQYAGQHFVLPGAQGKTTTRMGGDHTDTRNGRPDPQIQQQMHGVLDDQLASKQKQIAKGKHWTIPFKIHTTPVKDFGNIFHRGSMFF
ncbi:centriolin-like [Amphiura filiformis]|uniref:centriolin-like n=1 Tax=Amphiura filiformis TaxID=82378 RepID=UPI003B22472C